MLLVFAPNGGASKVTTTSNERGWTRWTGIWRNRQAQPDRSTDAVVAQWKASWLEGAESGWKAVASDANPYAGGQERSAWDAGWRWAQMNPDRRKPGAPRLAHRRRRAHDSTAPLTRALQLSAMGVTVFWASRALHRWARGPRRES